MNTRKKIAIKHQYKNLNFYSVPLSILFIVRKRLNSIFFTLALLFILLFSIV